MKAVDPKAKSVDGGWNTQTRFYSFVEEMPSNEKIQGLVGRVAIGELPKTTIIVQKKIIVSVAKYANYVEFITLADLIEAAFNQEDEPAQESAVPNV